MDLTILFNQLVTIESRLNALIEFKFRDNPEQLIEFNKTVQGHREIILKELSDQYPEMVQIQKPK